MAIKNYSLHRDNFERQVRHLVERYTDDYLHKDSKADILITIEEELRKQYAEAH